jgi:hypothetical protein
MNALSQWKYKEETDVVFECLAHKGKLLPDIIRHIFDYGIVVPELYEGDLTQTQFTARSYGFFKDNDGWPITLSCAAAINLVCTSGHLMKNQGSRFHLQFEFVCSNSDETITHQDSPKTFSLPSITDSKVFGPNLTFVRSPELDPSFEWPFYKSKSWCHLISVPKRETDDLFYTSVEYRAFIYWIIEI